MSLAFLTPSTAATAPTAESPFAAPMGSAGASFEVRDGWSVPASFGSALPELHALAHTTGWTDASHLGKFEVHVTEANSDRLASRGLKLGNAARNGDAWWLLLTPVRALVVCEGHATEQTRTQLAAETDFHVVDVTTQYAALRLAGPDVRELFARFCALDLRPNHTAVRAVIPGSVARTPSLVIREGDNQFLLLSGAAYATYLWTVVADAGRSLGGSPVGVDRIPAPSIAEEANTHA